ncbi:HAD hydrolase-like protein [Leptolyngbya sp. NK1-12]|uniref:HAD hydrolase-like protein n=1 Tax=Leptolyngbya sp. NK1-12 TaxID=2547451 RepID=A0AA97AH26_9CYAN|nr:HAD hydrolase-like protein [Leptolyngbya sp. NK1-12]
MAKIELVVCDMAGTTVQDNGEVQRCFLEAAAATGLQADPDKIRFMMGWSKKLVFQTLWQAQIGVEHPNYETRVNASFNQFKLILEDYYRTQAVQPAEGCLELFAWLKSQHIKIALTTGFYREVTNIILERLGWNQGLAANYVGSAESMIQVSVTPSEIYANEGRPAPFMIQKAMYYLKIRDPKAVVNIGDTPSDIESGYNANCLLSFGITNGSHTKEQLEAYPNDGLLASLHELKDRIASL